MPGYEIAEQNIQVDHIYLFRAIRQKCAIDEVTGEMKQYSTGRLVNKFAWLRKVYWKKAGSLLASIFLSADWIG